MYQITLLENIHPEAVDLLKKEGFELILNKDSLKEAEMIDLCKNSQGIGVRSRTQLSEKLIKHLPKLECVGAFCVGVNHIDTEYLFQKGVPVFNAPYSNTRSVSELVIQFIINLYRNISYSDRSLHEGKWEKSYLGKHEIRGKTLGIVGYGHIGSQVSVLCESLGMKVIYYDIEKKLPLGNAKSCTSLKSLLEKADIVSLHVPETEETKNMMNQKTLSYMKKDSYLINTSRGSVLNIKDVKEKLDEKKIKGLAIDVFPEEPKKKEDLNFKFPLQKYPQVILTPHIGGSTEEAQRSIGLEVASSFIDFFKKAHTKGSVNFPELSLNTPLKNTYRICHIHKNTPGVLSQVNSILSKHSVNIVGQFLSTKKDLGYLVMDLENVKDTKVINEKIKALTETIKMRWIS